ncbi:MAG: N-formylglutamate amidohydrolase [Brevundimonas sp.]|uniref:N-formylglutamate amidohydrolase n=1 Tax=Brevundimonas sp. TaxID=1871086 RepID=UPI000DB518C6|nr:N-formylglutamate amidohydrolase [Brevundimonas sp.]PZU75802.1 MAG: N-formylglutamate amidohydrolase [Brevundimonas sp.]
MTDAGETFSITQPPPHRAAGALVFGSPHSGDLYPDDMGAAGDLSIHSLRSAEDALVAQLVADGPRHGAPLIVGRLGRAYVDLNRDPDELDPALIEGAQGPVGAKTAAGYGVMPRLTGDGRPLYDRRLTLDEARRRIAAAHRPYHEALAALMQAARERQGRAVLIDWHSMPTRAAGAEVVLGDRHGSACRARLTRRLRDLFQAAGWRVSLNLPYAGGWSTQSWGRPDDGFEAIQIEISRGLYLDEATLRPNATFDLTRRTVSRVIAALCAEDWAA